MSVYTFILKWEVSISNDFSLIQQQSKYFEVIWIFDGFLCEWERTLWSLGWHLKQVPKDTLGSGTHGRGSNQALIGKRDMGIRYMVHAIKRHIGLHWVYVRTFHLWLFQGPQCPQISTTISLKISKKTKKNKKTSWTKWLGMSSNITYVIYPIANTICHTSYSSSPLCDLTAISNKSLQLKLSLWSTCNF